MHRGDDRAAAKEQQALEEGVRKKVENAEAVAANAEADEHVAELRARRIGDDLLDVHLNPGDGRSEEGRRAPDDGDDAERDRRHLE